MAKKERRSVTANKEVATPSTNNLTNTSRVSFWKKNINAVLVFTVLSFLMYGYTLFADYVLDDQIVITDNKFTKKGMGGIADLLSKETFVGYFGEQKDLVMGARYRPLSLVTFAIEHAVFKKPVYDDIKSTVDKKVFKKDKFGTDLYLAPPAVGHFNNILLFLLSTLLLYKVLLMLFPSESERWYFNIPFVASLLFLLHPIHIEAVANIKGRDEILSFIGAFATLYYVLKHKETGSFMALVKAVVVFFLALLSKENALTFLAIVPLTLYCFKGYELKESLKSVLPLLLTFFIYLLIRVAIIGYLLGNGKEITDIMNNPFYGMATSDKFATIFYTLGRYVQLLCFPHPLTHDYYPYQIPIMHWSQWESFGSLLLYLAMGAYGVWSVLKNRSVIGFSILFYLITLSIVSNIPFSIGTFMNDRFVYLSSVGFCLLLAYLFVKVVGEKQTALAMGLTGVLLLGYAAKTILRVPDWKDTKSLNSAAVKISSNSARANLFYGVALFTEAQRMVKPEDAAQRKENMYQALPYVEKAISILPTYGSAMHMASGIDAEIFQYDKDIDKILNRYAVYLQQRELLTIEDVAKNATFIDKYLEYFDGFPQYRDKMIAFYVKVGQHCITEKKDFTNAIRYASNGLRLAPGNLELSAVMSQAQQMKMTNPIKNK